MSFSNILLISAAGSNLILGFLVYFYDRKNLTNRIFGLLALAITLWFVGSIVFYLSSFSSPDSLWLARLLYAIPIIIVAVLLYFTNIFPMGVKPLIWKTLAIFIPVAIFIPIVLFSDLIIENTFGGFYQERSFGPLFFFYSFFIVIYAILSTFTLFNKYRRGEKALKSQIRYIFAGISISAVLGIFISIVLPFFDVLAVDRFGPASTVVMVGFFAYAIAKYNLMNIRVFATEFLTIILSFIIFVNSVFSGNLNEFLINIALFIMVASVGYLLVRSIRREVIIRRKLEDLTWKLQIANRDLLKLNKTKSEFLSIASHQLRTPLSIIKGYISVILEGDMGVLNEGQEKYLQRAYKSNEKLIDLVGDLLDLSRIESGRINYKFKIVNPLDLTLGVIEEFKLKSTEKNLYLKMESRQKIFPFILADEEKLSQALMNIIDNAIKYTRQGGVTVRLSFDDKNIVWAVKDTGVGIEPDETLKIFEKFTRGRGSAKIEGTGLGLYVAKKIIEEHQGGIQAESGGAGKGSAFYVKIPINS